MGACFSRPTVPAGVRRILTNRKNDFVGRKGYMWRFGRVWI